MTTDWVLRGNVRLKIESFHDGWGWHAWEARTQDGWLAFRAPAPANAHRRFRAPHEAEAFFLLLSEFIADTGTEVRSALQMRPRELTSSAPRSQC
jgi:hypothetical protein